ncbi:hypothetical protein AVEN_118227-1 [Araneus ventricosus]|uniref:Uncharacterized protein n=1 Tax=Araneus ventricosus TaxID=182803 RepID=A0A4Y2JQ03_ARAVE|nr:hypothetical protein AVEN_118227-1 [Araneus ventricosus]
MICIFAETAVLDPTASISGTFRKSINLGRWAPQTTSWLNSLICFVPLRDFDSRKEVARKKEDIFDLGRLTIVRRWDRTYLKLNDMEAKKVFKKEKSFEKT